MNIRAVFILFNLSLGMAWGQSNPDSHQVKGYTDKRGAYHQPHRQTNPNKTEKDNYGSKGNINPYNGKEGKKTPKK